MKDFKDYKNLVESLDVEGFGLIVTETSPDDGFATWDYNYELKETKENGDFVNHPVLAPIMAMDLTKATNMLDNRQQMTEDQLLDFIEDSIRRITSFK